MELTDLVGKKVTFSTEYGVFEATVSALEGEMVFFTNRMALGTKDRTENDQKRPDAWFNMAARTFHSIVISPEGPKLKDLVSKKP